MFKKLSSRKFKMGAYGAAITAILAVILILVNVVSVLLTNRADAFIDLTADSAFEISEEIQETLISIDVPVTITVLYGEQDFQSITPYCAQVVYILDQAEKLNENISVRYIDPVQNPEVASQYPQLDCTQGDLVFENMNTGRASEVLFSDLFYISNSSITGSKAEAVIASKLLSMTTTESFVVSFTTGHGEDDYSTETFRELLELNNYTVTDTATLTESIADDVMCVIITGPSVDFSQEEIKKLEEFLINDGEYGKSVLYFSSMGNLDMPLLEGFLANYGFAIGDEVVGETNSNYVYGEKASYALSGYMEETYSAKALSQSLYSISPFTRPVNILFSSSDSVRVTELMCFSTSAVAINPNDTTQKIYGSDQTLYSAAVSELYEYVSGEGERSSHICVFGSVYFIDDTMLATESLGNAEYMVGVMSQIAPNEISIEVASKSILGGYMTINATAAKWLGIVFIGIVPVLVVAAGIYVYIRRRNR